MSFFFSIKLVEKDAYQILMGMVNHLVVLLRETYEAIRHRRLKNPEHATLTLMYVIIAEHLTANTRIFEEKK